MTRVLVTGATGFTAPYLFDALRDEFGDPRIIGWGRRPNEGLGITEFREVELTDPESVEHAVRSLPQIDYVVHLAGAMPPRTVAELWHANVRGTATLMAALVSAEHRPRFLNIGSAAEYAPKTSGQALVETDSCLSVNEYGRSKWAQEQIALAFGRESGTDVIAARSFNILGPGLPESFVAGRIAEQLKDAEAKAVKLGGLSSERDFIDVRDAAAAYVALLVHGRAGEVYNVCSGRATSIGDLADMMLEISGRDISIDSKADRIVRKEADRVLGSNAKIIAAAPWRVAVDLADSLRDMLRS